MSIIISNTIKFIERKLNFPKPGKIYDVKLLNQYIKVFKEELRALVRESKIDEVIDV